MSARAISLSGWILLTGLGAAIMVDAFASGGQLELVVLSLLVLALACGLRSQRG
jgi:hypothetical protein